MSHLSETYELGWYRNSIGRRVEVLAIDEVRPGVDEEYFPVAAYRYEGRAFIHIRSIADLTDWEPEAKE